MNKVSLVTLTLLILFLYAVPGLNGQGLDDLADKTANSILDYFNDKHNINTSIVNYENLAGISGAAAQKFYQLLVSKLETISMIGFSDLMINFNQNKGEFNLNRVHSLNYLIYIRLIRNKTAIGTGVSIFSRTLDKIVYNKYVESEFVQSEEQILEVSPLDFKGAGFSRVVELEARRNLLDVRSIPDSNSIETLAFLYPDKIDFFKVNESQLEKFFSQKIEWTRPFYPALEPEGKLSFFIESGVVYAGAGTNFSRYSKIFAFKGEKWEDVQSAELDFVPFRLITLNNSLYLAGARFALGRNYFENKLVLAPFQWDQLTQNNRNLLEKQVVPFYALEFSTNENSRVLNSIHIVDREYKYRFFGDNFEQMTVEKAERGAALSALDGQWLAASDFSRGRDKLYFYKIENGGRRQVYENMIDGEIIFISEGVWKSSPGFWVYIKVCLDRSSSNTDEKSGIMEYKLQFWSKKSE